MNWAKTIKPKSDQLNADDFLGGITKVITITDVTVKDSAEQPAIIHYQGDAGKPWKPCKTMCKLIAEAWGMDEREFVGRSIELYRDDTVTWAGETVGGIRIKAMSHIKEQRLRRALQISKGKRKTFTVERLDIAPQNSTQPEPAPQYTPAQLDKVRDGLLAVVDAMAEIHHVEAFRADTSGRLAKLEAASPERHKEVMGALQIKKDEIKQQEGQQP